VGDDRLRASEEHTRALLERAGFTAVRTEQVTVRFAFRDIDDYSTYASDTGGPARWCSGDCLRTSSRASSGSSLPRSPPSAPAEATSFRASRSTPSPAEIVDGFASS
jgi:hypothetical protein